MTQVRPFSHVGRLTRMRTATHCSFPATNRRFTVRSLHQTEKPSACTALSSPRAPTSRLCEAAKAYSTLLSKMLSSWQLPIFIMTVQKYSTANPQHAPLNCYWIKVNRLPRDRKCIAMLRHTPKCKRLLDHKCDIPLRVGAGELDIRDDWVCEVALEMTI